MTTRYLGVNVFTMLDHAPDESPAPWSSTSVWPLPAVQMDWGPIGLGTSAWVNPAPARARVFMSAYTESGRFHRNQSPLATTSRMTAAAVMPRRAPRVTGLFLLAA